MIRAIIEEHALEGAALFEQRRAVFRAPDRDLDDLCRFDMRLEAHVDALRIGGRGAANVVGRALDLAGGGEMFVAALVAIEGRSPELVATVTEAACADPQLVAAASAAFGWAAESDAEPFIVELAASALPALRRVALAARVLHRADPGASLLAALADVDPGLRARALEAVGELGLSALLGAVRIELDADEPACRLAAALSAALIGASAEASSVLRELAEGEHSFSDVAARAAGAAMPLSDGVAWVRALLRANRRRLAALAAGSVGSAALAPDLLEVMDNPATSRVCAEAFTMITGIRAGEGTSPPAGFRGGPTENPADEDVSMDPDDGLAWPDRAALARAYETGAPLDSSERLLLGRQRDEPWLAEVLRRGRQRERIEAARALAMLASGRPLFDAFARADRQRGRLANLEIR